MFEEVIANPERFRDGENFRATNIVFPVKVGDQRLILKRPRALGSLINLYYVLQDLGFYRTRKLSTVKQRLQREAECLQELDGLHAPRLIEFQDGILLREYLEGTDFRNLESDMKRIAVLEAGLQALIDIHEKGLVVGDAHVKNLFDTEHETYWLDFDGEFDETNPLLAQAIDYLKFVYSTYSATRFPDTATYAATLVSQNVKGDVRDTLRELTSPGLSSLRLWFPTRLPLDGQLNRDIKRILRA